MVARSERRRIRRWTPDFEVRCLRKRLPNDLALDRRWYNLPTLAGSDTVLRATSWTIRDSIREQVINDGWLMRLTLRTCWAVRRNEGYYRYARVARGGADDAVSSQPYRLTGYDTRDSVFPLVTRHQKPAFYCGTPASR